MPAVLSELSVGQDIGSRRIEVSRLDLIRYAGASGDFNPIHWNEAFARQVGLPGVIAHGMFTMGAAVQLVTDWAGDPGAVLDYQTRFTKPVPVPDPTATDATAEDATAEDTAEAGAPGSGDAGSEAATLGASSEAAFAVVEVRGVIGALNPEASTARVDLTVTAGGQKVLVKAQALVRVA
ncbi:MAG: acyl dehydratase [Micrococcaceae bacterium]|nr:acyl dehydratase [Micrococcaceae bacterium]